MTILNEMADYALTLQLEKMKSDAIEIGKSFLMDTLGCIIAGSQQKPSLLALDFCKKMYGEEKKTATVIGSGGIKLNTCSASFINGVSSHFHDYDDMLPTLSGHPSAAVLPCVLALCEELNKSGKDVLETYIAGVEIIDILSRGLNSKTLVHYSKGWHSTQTIGIFGATAAAGILLGLTSKQLTTAFSIAASESCGLQGNFGTMTKAFHAGRASEKGILIAKLAQAGFTANPDIIEMDGGYVKATADGFLDKDSMLERMQTRESAFIDPGVTMKPYPCCKCTHNIIDDIWNLMNKYKFKNEDVEKVLVQAQPLTIACLKYPEAKTMLEGKFSAQYGVALVLVNEKLPGIPNFDGTEITDQRVLETMKKITMVRDDSIAAGEFFAGNWETRMIVTLKDGRELKESVVYARGEAQNPMTQEQVLDKFRECMDVSLFSEKSKPVIGMLQNLESLSSARELLDAIESAARPMSVI
jgi:2-methylcitrate dehydratase PrpD